MRENLYLHRYLVRELLLPDLNVPFLKFVKILSPSFIFDHSLIHGCLWLLLESLGCGAHVIRFSNHACQQHAANDAHATRM